MTAFFNQGGYAFFVWGAFSVTFLLLIAEVIQLRRSNRTILSRVGRLVRLRDSREAASGGTTQTATTTTAADTESADAEHRGE